MACIAAPACSAALAEATRRFPGRSRASDGICASPTHTKQNPGSDHEPHVVAAGRAYATAFDLTDDKAGGCDADAFAETLRIRRDARVKYVICNRRIFSSYATSSRPAWEWGPYTGANPHEKHTHVSIKPEAVFSDAPWFADPPRPKTPAKLDPPATVVDALATPKADGAWLLGPDGAIWTTGAAPYLGGMNTSQNRPDFVGRTAARLERFGTGYRIVATSGETYVPKR